MAGTKDSKFNIMWNLFDWIIPKLVEFFVILKSISGFQPQLCRTLYEGLRFGLRKVGLNTF
jgi:hypothetical protein